MDHVRFKKIGTKKVRFKAAVPMADWKGLGDRMAKLKPCTKAAAKDLQLMVRAEAGALAMNVRVVVNGQMSKVFSGIGECACVTCGQVLAYKSAKGLGFQGMDGGHFLAKCQTSRVYLWEQNVFPQCVSCNKHRSGAGDDYELYMRTIWGQELIDCMRWFKNTDAAEWAGWPDRELIAMREGWRLRTKIAQTVMGKL